MVFCNHVIDEVFNCPLSCHNPYFNRWFSAIALLSLVNEMLDNGHNPYFNRWFSAIAIHCPEAIKGHWSQSLF